MKLTEIPDLPNPEDFSIDEHTRSKGVHLSDITKAMDEEMGVKYDSSWGEKSALFIMGFLWERLLTRVMMQARSEKGMLVSAGEHEMDGIYLTPDGMAIDRWEHEEWKCTWQSSNKDPMEFYKYWRQIKAGCLALGTNVGILRVLFVMGDYKGSGPLWKTWRAEFTDRELKENWDQIKNFAKKKGMI